MVRWNFPIQGRCATPATSVAQPMVSGSANNLKAQPSSSLHWPPVYRPEPPRTPQLKAMPIKPMGFGTNAFSVGAAQRSQAEKLPQARGHLMSAVQRRPNGVVQRVLFNSGSGQYVSTCDKATVIDANNAAISVAATQNNWFGGHAEIYLEMFENGVPVEYSIDMFGVNNAKALVRMKRYSAGGLNSRSKGGVTTYAITTNQADRALVDATDLKIKAENGTLKYEYYFSKGWNLVSSTTWMNCTDFAEHILKAAGVTGVSSGLLSMPGTLATKSAWT